MQPKRSLGQNFLRDNGVIDRIIEALGPLPTDTVVEIGPGDGALTGKLLQSAEKVIAIEFDRDLVSVLKKRFASAVNFELIEADALSVDFSRFQGTKNNTDKLKLAANLPYNISTPILQRLMGQRSLFSKMVLMFQREVVNRIMAEPGNSERGYLTVLAEAAFEREWLFDVPPEAFVPVPKVWSAVVRLTPTKSVVENEALFREVVSLSFAQKRKTILNNLKMKYAGAAAILTACEIDGRRRAETLTLEEWARLTAVISDVKNR